ncbi:MAG: DUF488 domain-containing protein [Magnetococcus sp. YQC-3]
MSDRVYTIGHSSHTVEHFIELIRRHGVTAVADVRSHPYSRFAPQFSQDQLKFSLKKSGIAYVFLGKELGARSKNMTCYHQGKVQYDLLAKESLFSEGLQRVQTGMKKYSLALMCSEKDPMECHRAILVARQLHAKGISVSHILADGQQMEHAELEKRLLEMHKLSERNLFDSYEEILDQAYMMQGCRIAYQTDITKQQGFPLGM